MKDRIFLKLIIIWVFVLGPGAVDGWSAESEWDQGLSTDLMELGLEDLMNIQVTSVSKKEQSLFDSASAIYVVTREDIRRSGATSVAEALRMVPGIQVAHINSSQKAITSRGFDSQFSNKLLVLMDGRSVYSPLDSGVYWEVQDTMLEDIDRIEVIRGPGGTIWGANAVNGVINIITRNSKDTQGGLVTGGGGTEERGFGGLRFGGEAGDDLSYRVYAKYLNRDEFVDSDGHRTSDDWDMMRGGFRADWEISEHDSVRVQGDIYEGQARHTMTLTGYLTPSYLRIVDGEMDQFGGNVLTSWKHEFSKKSDMTTQLYYDRLEQHPPSNVAGQKLDTLDFELNHRLELGEHQEIIWGLGYRFNTDDFHSCESVSFDPDKLDAHLASVFIQDEISFMEDRLYLTVGSKFEHNDYTGFEFQPSLRVLGKPHENHRVWAAVSRVVRTPARMDNDARLNFLSFPDPTAPDPASATILQFSLFGDNDFESEDLLAVELGYRGQPTERFLLDATAFYNFYDHLQTWDWGDSFPEASPFPHLVIPLYYGNNMDGETYGAELAATVDVMDRWKLSGGYSWLKMQLDTDKSSKMSNEFFNIESLFSSVGEAEEGNAPLNQIHLRSHFDLPRDVDFDIAAYYVDSLISLNVHSYTRLDTRLGWSPVEDLDIDVVFQNLLEPYHKEFNTITIFNASEVQRSVYGKVTWRF